MPHSWNAVHVSQSPERAFDFISDFRHAPLWDPRTRNVRLLDPEPVGRGTRFSLTAAVFGLTLELPYEILEYDRPKLLIFSGRTQLFDYRERVTFTPEGSGTRIEWDATMQLRSLLTLGNPVLALLYQRIGDDAVGGIAAALERAG